MPIEPKLAEFPDPPTKMGHSFFKSLRDRIETIAPIQTTQSGGKGVGLIKKEIIKVEYINDEGCKISFNGEIEELTVCSSGIPGKIKILVAPD